MTSTSRTPLCAALLSAVLVTAGLLTASCSGTFSPTSGSGTSSGADGVQTETKDQTFREPITRLALDSDAGIVALSAGPDGQVDVQQRLEWTGGKPEVSTTVEGDTLRVTARCPPGNQVNRRCQVGFTIRMPVATVVDAKTSAGAIKADQLAGDQRLTTTAGAITATGLKADVVEARSTAGAVDLGFAEPPRTVTVESTAGGIDIAVPNDGERYRVQAQTTAGRTSIKVAEDQASNRRISARSTAGGVTVRYS